VFLCLVADKRFVFVLGDIRDAAGVKNALRGADCVWHNCAAVGPYHPQKLYQEVNYMGTVNVVNACRELGISKIVMSSSPSTRFTGANVNGLTEDQLPKIPQKSYVQEYAASKVREREREKRAAKQIKQKSKKRQKKQSFVFEAMVFRQWEKSF
jgi:nucleoside-diphosphate-sugar epimerase